MLSEINPYSTFYATLSRANKSLFKRLIFQSTQLELNYLELKYLGKESSSELTRALNDLKKTLNPLTDYLLAEQSVNESSLSFYLLARGDPAGELFALVEIKIALAEKLLEELKSLRQEELKEPPKTD